MKTLTKYDIRVVVSNRLDLVLVIRFIYKIWGIDTYLPREGSETFFLSSFRFQSNSISPYLPREGPEIFQQGLLQIANGVSVYLPIYLERGRKPAGIKCKPVVIVSIVTYLPREGTETWFSWYFWFFNNRIATYLPREGPETCST